jgi:hypothetical protein
MGPFRVTLSVGVALYPSRDVRSKDSLLRASDAALHQAKRDGGNRICVFQQHGYLYTPVQGPGRDEERNPASKRSLTLSSRPPPGSTKNPALSVQGPGRRKPSDRPLGGVRASDRPPPNKRS